jgi:hypothetical protein
MRTARNRGTVLLEDQAGVVFACGEFGEGDLSGHGWLRLFVIFATGGSCFGSSLRRERLA